MGLDALAFLKLPFYDFPRRVGLGTDTDSPVRPGVAFVCLEHSLYSLIPSIYLKNIFSTEHRSMPFTVQEVTR